jgi:hypothetical protein
MAAENPNGDAQTLPDTEVAILLIPTGESSGGDLETAEKRIQRI